MNPHDEQKLERLIQQTLRDLPPRRAPRSLEQRVLAALEQRAALPWWRKGFVYWPPAARAAFVMLAVTVVAGFSWLLTGVDAGPVVARLIPTFAWIDGIASIASASREFVEVVLRSIPSTWLYGGLIAVASLYAALFGLGATAYRLLYAHR